MKKILRVVYIILLTISFVVVGISIAIRHTTEMEADKVEITLDYQQFSELAKQISMPVDKFFAQMHKYGYNSVSLNERSLRNLKAEGVAIEYGILKEIQGNIDWKSFYSEEAVKFLENEAKYFDMVARTYDKALFTSLKQALSSRYKKDFYRVYEGPNSLGKTAYTIVLRGKKEDVLSSKGAVEQNGVLNDIRRRKSSFGSILDQIGLGYDEEKINNVKRAGIPLNLRPASYSSADQDKLVRAYFTDVDKYGADNTSIVFQGMTVLGYSAESPYNDILRDELKKRNTVIALIEADDQLGYVDMPGMIEIGKASDYNVSRLFAVVDYIQRMYNFMGYSTGGKEVENIFYRNAIDRNIRIMYMRPFKHNTYTYVEDINIYEQLIENFGKRLEPHAMEVGIANPMRPKNFHNSWVVLALSYGALVFAMMAFKLVFSPKYKLELIIFLTGIVLVPLAIKIAPEKSILLAALGTSLVFPVFAFAFFTEYMRDILMSKRQLRTLAIAGKAVTIFLIIVAICMIGGLFIASILGRHDFLLEIKYFRGVKISLFLPAIVSVVIYALKFGFGKQLGSEDLHYKDLVKMLRANVKLYTLFIAVLLGAIAYLYVQRSGNTSSLRITNFEHLFRNFLENDLIVRPRFKEFLFAFPSFFIAVFFATKGHKRSSFPFMVASVLGFSSIVNTFSHIRTNTYVSVYRVLISAGLSIIIGVLGIFILSGIYGFVQDSIYKFRVAKLSEERSGDA